jgi:hypothetical protein
MCYHAIIFRASLVGIGTDYGLDGQGSIFGTGKRFFSSPQCSDRLWGPPGALFPEQKWSVCEAGYSSPSSTEVNNDGVIPPLCIFLHGVARN